MRRGRLLVVSCQASVVGFATALAASEWRVKFAGLELATYDERSKEMKQIGGSARANSKGKKYKQRVQPMRPA